MVARAKLWIALVVTISASLVLASYSSRGALALSTTGQSDVVYYFYIYGSSGCPYCISMKEFLARTYGEDRVYFCSIDREGENYTRFSELVSKGFLRAIPLTFIVYNYTVSAAIIGSFENPEAINELLKTNFEARVPIYTAADSELVIYKYMVVEGSHAAFIAKYLCWDKYCGDLGVDSSALDFRLVSPEALDFEAMLVAVLPALVVYSLLDSVNPCTIMIYFSLVASSLSGKKSVGPPVLFILIVYVGYLLFGCLVLLAALAIPREAMPSKLLIGIALVMGIYTIVRAGREKAPSFKCDWCERIGLVHKLLSSKYALATVLALISVVVLLPCTSGPLAGFVGILVNYVERVSAENLFRAAFLLAIYNVIFVLPLIIILVLVYSMQKEKRVAAWLKENGPAVEFLVGFVLVLFSLILLLST